MCASAKSEIHGVVVSHDYGTDDKSFGSHKPPMFNDDTDTFSWWKSKMYSHIIGIDEELWDILEDDVDLTLDEEGVAVDRKKHTVAEKKLYKNTWRWVTNLLLKLWRQQEGSRS